MIQLLSEGVVINVDPESLPMDYTWNADGTLASRTFHLGSQSWIKHYTYSNGILTHIGGWEQQ